MAAAREEIWGQDAPRDVRRELQDPQKATKIARFLMKTGSLGQIGRPDRSTEASLR